MIRVLAPGPLTTVQDAGRPGYLALGVPPSGALDRPSFGYANRLVGNDPDAPALEITIGPARLLAETDLVVAVTGASCPMTVDGASVQPPGPYAVPAGSVLAIGRAVAGVRAYLAVRGGVAVPQVLGSCSTDLLSGLGPAPLRAGDVLSLGDRASRQLPGPADLSPPAPPVRDPVVRIVPGPRDDWFATDALETLFSSPYTVTPQSNRVSVRLDGPALRRVVHGELPSEGTVVGAVEVPTNGLPLILLADHPVTIGYPVVGVVVGDDLPILAQTRPGGVIRFHRKQQA
jgi:biotin-dependent carboxylase-like uncharacterized protein